MKYARVGGAGFVIERRELGGPPPVPLDRGTRWLYDNQPASVPWYQMAVANEPVAPTATRVNYMLVDRPLADVQTDQKSTITAIYMAKIAIGFVYIGHLYQIDDASQARITAVSDWASKALHDGVMWPSTLAWRTADNLMIPMLMPADMILFAAAVANYVLALRQNMWSLIDQTAGAVTMAQVVAIDVNSGWPT